MEKEKIFYNKNMQIISNNKTFNKLDKAIYLVFGDEALLVLETAEAIRNTAIKQGFTERRLLSVINNMFSWNELANAGGNMSLFGDKTLIDLRIPNGKLGKDGSKEIIKWCDNIKNYAKSNLLLIIMPELTWQDEKTAWFQKIDKIGEIYKIIAPKNEDLPKWLLQRLQKYQLTADEESLRYLAERIEGNLLAAHQEIQKLALIYAKKNNEQITKLTLPEIKAALVDMSRYDLDDLRETFLSADLQKFCKVLENLLQEGEPLTLIVWAITEDVRTLYALKHLQYATNETNISILLKKLNIWGIRQTWLKTAWQNMHNAQNRAKNWKSRLTTALNACAALDKKIKGADRLEQPVIELLLRLALILFKS